MMRLKPYLHPLAVSAVLGLAAHPAAAAPPGALDSSFGAGGLVEMEAGSQLRGAAVAPDGRLLVTGSLGGTRAQRLFVARFMPSGAPDRSFGADGRTVVPLPSGATATSGAAVVLDGGGRIVVVGDIRSRSGSDGVVAVRLGSSGSPDRSFAGDGVSAVLRGGDHQAQAADVALRADGEIVIGGAAVAEGERVPAPAIVRISSAGALIARTTVASGPGAIQGLALRGDGRIVFAGTRQDGQRVLSFVGRALPDGGADAEFRGNGVISRDLARGGAAGSGLRDVAIQPDGRIVAVGFAFDGSGGTAPGAYAVTLRTTGDGTPDDSFGGTNGVRYTRAASGPDPARVPPPGGNGVAVDGEGDHIYTGGSYDEAGTSVFQVQAQGFDGRDDSGFGSGGTTRTPVRGFQAPAFGAGLALSGQGLYLVGTTGTLGTDDMRGAIVRYGAHPYTVPAPGRTPPGSDPEAGPGNGTGEPRRARVLRLTLSSRRLSRRGSVTMTYVLTAAGRVRLRIERRTGSGRYVRFGSARSLRGRRGTNRVRISRTIAGRRFIAGTYRIVLQPLAGSRVTGQPRAISLRVPTA